MQKNTEKRGLKNGQKRRLKKVFFQRFGRPRTLLPQYQVKIAFCPKNDPYHKHQNDKK